METDNLIEAIKKTRDSVVKQVRSRVLIASVTALNGEHTARIVEKGLDSSDNKIGDYSTKPYYATKESFVRKSAFKPKGKTGEKKFPNGQPHKSMYLQRGYKEFRDIQSRQTDKVNLELTGSLIKNKTVVEVSENEVAIALTSEKEIAKRKGLEKKYKKKIFAASPNDLKYLSGVISNELEAVKSDI